VEHLVDAAHGGVDAFDSVQGRFRGRVARDFEVAGGRKAILVILAVFIVFFDSHHNVF
jgi:hypothetical protein